MKLELYADFKDKSKISFNTIKSSNKHILDLNNLVIFCSICNKEKKLDNFKTCESCRTKNRIRKQKNRIKLKKMKGGKSNK